MTSLNIFEYLEYLRNRNQDAPRIGNPYLQDSALIQYTQRILGKNITFLKELERLGDRFNNLYIQQANNAQRYPPILEQFDSFGKRIDKLHLSEGWRNISRYSTQDGIVALAYQQDKFNLKQYQRFGQLVALYLYQPYSGLVGCPLAMSDGAAYTIKKILENPNVKQKVRLQKYFKKLVTRDPSLSWTSGQWMTEKRGGSDVSFTQTIAMKTQNKKGKQFYKMYGYKWFTSATDSQMTLALAKIIPQGQKLNPKQIQNLPLSLFVIKLRNKHGELNNIQIIRLKDKLGTKQLPTAQLLLKGCKGYLISQEGKGVKLISNMLTITRLYNASSSVSAIRKILSLARDYASRRVVFKKLLTQQPLQLVVLSDLQVIYRGNLIFYLKLSQLFSKEHAKTINERDSNILRIMTPVLKLFTAKEAVAAYSQGLQCFGGLGYIEGTSLPRGQRDTQVLTIWQGTTNVLCYDFVRAILTTKSDAIQSFCNFVMQIMDKYISAEIRNTVFNDAHVKLVLSYNEFIKDLRNARNKMFIGFQNELRSFAFGAARIFIAVLLQQYAILEPRNKNIQIFKRWINSKQLYSRRNNDKQIERQLALDLNALNQMKHSGNIDKRGIVRPKI